MTIKNNIMKTKIESLQILFNRAYVADTQNMDKALRILRENDATQIESVKVLIKSLKIGLKEADDIVRNSEAWLDKKEDTNQVRGAFWDALSKLSK